jgi:hypothetical protein
VALVKEEVKTALLYTEVNAAAKHSAAGHRVEATEEARNIQQTINHIPGDSVERGMHKKYKRTI